MSANTNTEDPKSPLPPPTIHITTHNADGKATVHSSTNEPPAPYTGMRTSGTLVYTTSQFPPNLNADADLTQHNALASGGKVGIVHQGGTICRIVDFAPQNNVMMHRTQSLDYGIVLEGTMLMELDDGSVTKMTKGDVAVQRATMHAWRNGSETERARMMFVLQECEPLSVGGEKLGEDLGKGAHVQKW